MRRLLASAVVVLLVVVGAADAAAPAVSVDALSVQETNFDVVALVTARLAGPSSQAVTVQYGTSDGTADATDYVAAFGTVTFAAGTTQSRIPVLIKGDALDEADETFFVDVDGVRSTVTIVDDPEDRVPSLGPLQVVAADVQARWDVHRTYTGVRKLVVRSAPATSSIDVMCRGDGCPFGGKTATRNLTHLFGHAKLRPGAAIRVTVDAPGEIGLRFAYKFRAGKRPLRTVSVLD
jgi:hypothetical protein